MGAPRLMVVLLGMLSWLVSPMASAKPGLADQADVRVLIDISGSMKQNDPQNLRRPALRLLVGLLPKDTRAGVWTFGQYVNMLVPLGQVDRAWKYRARQDSKKIGSPGQFTNIEDALNRATEDWTQASRPLRRDVILLTDGMVDIAKDQTQSQASRRRILESILPRLQGLGVSVHTIALSDNADHELMQELAKSTGGWYEQVENAEQLQKVFLRIFEKVGKPDAVPLKDNRFTIDESITEATVLVFHRPGAEPTQVVTPSGQSFGANNAPSSVIWHRDEGYDMLTINDPDAGEWRLRAEIDPDNRVMVVTDLKMRTTELPNRLLVGQALPVEVSFTDHARPIRKKSFLQVVSVTATRQDDQDASEPRPLMDDGTSPDKRPEDGIFTLEFGGKDLRRGLGELVIRAESRTFVRERRMTYEVVPPVNLVVTPGASNGTLELSLSPDERLVKGPSIDAQTWLEDASGNRYPLDLEDRGDGLGQGEIDLENFSGARKLFVKATGVSLEGKPVEYIDSPVEVEGLKPKVETAQVPVAPVAEAAPPFAATAEAPAVPEMEAMDGQSDWLSTSIWFGAINLILLSSLTGGVWWLRRQSRQSLVNLIEDAPSGKPEAVEMEEKAA